MRCGLTQPQVRWQCMVSSEQQQSLVVPLKTVFLPAASHRGSPIGPPSSAGWQPRLGTAGHATVSMRCLGLDVNQTDVSTSNVFVCCCALLGCSILDRCNCYIASRCVASSDHMACTSAKYQILNDRPLQSKGGTQPPAHLVALTGWRQSVIVHASAHHSGKACIIADGYSHPYRRVCIPALDQPMPVSVL